MEDKPLELENSRPQCWALEEDVCWEAGPPRPGASSTIVALSLCWMLFANQVSLDDVYSHTGTSPLLTECTRSLDQLYLNRQFDILVGPR